MPQPCDFPASEMVPWSTGLCGKSLSLFPSQSPVCWALWTAGFLLPPGWLIYLVKLCWEACWEPYTFLLRAISGVSVFQRGTVCVCVCVLGRCQPLSYRDYIPMKHCDIQWYNPYLQTPPKNTNRNNNKKSAIAWSRMIQPMVPLSCARAWARSSHLTATQKK